MNALKKTILFKTMGPCLSVMRPFRVHLFGIFLSTILWDLPLHATPVEAYVLFFCKALGPGRCMKLMFHYFPPRLLLMFLARALVKQLQCGRVHEHSVGVLANQTFELLQTFSFEKELFSVTRSKC